VKKPYLRKLKTGATDQRPLREWTPEQLHREYERLDSEPGENPWAALRRQGKLHAELNRRFEARCATGEPFSEAEILQWGAWLGQETDPHDIYGQHFRAVWCRPATQPAAPALEFEPPKEDQDG
jgi:hypothetical protein